MPNGALLAPGFDRRMVEQRAAGEQEAAVATGGPASDRPGVDADHARAGVQRRAHGCEPGAAEPDHAYIGRGLPSSAVGFSQAAGSPHTGWAAAVTRGMLPEPPAVQDVSSRDARRGTRFAGACRPSRHRARGSSRRPRPRTSRGCSRSAPTSSPARCWPRYRAGIFPMPLTGSRQVALVQPRPARDRATGRLPAVALAAPLRAPLHGDRGRQLRRGRRGLRGPAPSWWLDHA